MKFRTILFYGLTLLFIAFFGGQSFTVSRMVGGEMVQQTFQVGQSVLVMVGGGTLLRAVITGLAKRGRVNVKFKGGQQGTVTKSAVYEKPEGMNGK